MQGAGAHSSFLNKLEVVGIFIRSSTWKSLYLFFIASYLLLLLDTDWSGYIILRYFLPNVFQVG